MKYDNTMHYMCTMISNINKAWSVVIKLTYDDSTFAFNKIKLELKGFITIYIKSMHRISPEI